MTDFGHADIKNINNSSSTGLLQQKTNESTNMEEDILVNIEDDIKNIEDDIKNIEDDIKNKEDNFKILNDFNKEDKIKEDDIEEDERKCLFCGEFGDLPEDGAGRLLYNR